MVAAKHAPPARRHAGRSIDTLVSTPATWAACARPDSIDRTERGRLDGSDDAHRIRSGETSAPAGIERFKAIRLVATSICPSA